MSEVIMDKSTVVWVKTQFVGFHRWADAPAEVAFLRDWHRHVFHVTAGVEVSGLDREVEFFTLQARVNAFLVTMYEGKQVPDSCETIAYRVLNQLKEWGYAPFYVTVSEDNENGATVFADSPNPNTLKLLMEVKAQQEQILARLDRLKEVLAPQGIVL